MELKDFNNFLNVMDITSQDSNTSVYNTMVSKTTYEDIKDKLSTDSLLFVNELDGAILLTKVLSKSNLLLNFLKYLKSKYESKFMFEKILDTALYHIISKCYIEGKNLFKEFLGNDVICFLMNNYQDGIYLNISIFIKSDSLILNVNANRHFLGGNDKITEVIINENNFNEFDSIIDKYYK